MADGRLIWDLMFQALEGPPGPGGGSLRAVLVYNTLLWKPETAQRLVDDYVGILRVMAATPDAPAS